MKKNILFIAHHFPPMGGPGTFRSLYFIKHLLDFGYQPYVLSISLKDIEEGQYPMDFSLQKKIPGSIQTIRTPTYEPRKFKKLLMRLRVFRIFWFLFYPVFWEPSALWIFSSFPAAKKIIKEKNIQLIYTSSGPYIPLLLGFLLKKRLNIPWVADIRDPFTDSYFWQWPGKLHWYFSRWMEKMILKNADKIIVNTPEVKKIYLKRKISDESKLVVLTNGFEEN